MLWLRLLFFIVVGVCGLLALLAVTTGKSGYWVRLKQVAKLGLWLALLILILFFLSRLLRL